MSDNQWDAQWNEQDPQVDRVLGGVSDAVAGYLRPPGVEAAYAKVRQRRRNRVVAVGFLTLALVVGPAVGFGLANAGRGAPVGHHPRPGPSATSSGPSPSAPSVSPSLGPGISADVLRNATLQIPTWPPGLSQSCRYGTVTFSAGKSIGDSVGTTSIELEGDPVYNDVNRDGVTDTTILVRCSPQGNDYKVMVFNAGTDGKIRTVGQLLASAGPAGRPGVDVMTIWAIGPGTDNQVRVDVGEYRPCCSMPMDLPQHQWRSYGWDGQRFVQTGGPTAFGPNPKITDLAVSTGGLLMTKSSGGQWTGHLTVVIRNAGPFPRPALLEVNFPGGVKNSGAGWTGCEVFYEQSSGLIARCPLGTLAVGASRTVTLTLVSTTSTTPAGTGHVLVYSSTDVDEQYPDLNQDNNAVQVPVRTA